MDLRNYYIEEDLFPSLFTNYLERPYGVLFYNPDNKDSFDSHEATSRISSGDRPHPEVRREAREPLADKPGESTHRSRSEWEKGLR